MILQLRPGGHHQPRVRGADCRKAAVSAKKFLQDSSPQGGIFSPGTVRDNPRLSRETAGASLCATIPERGENAFHQDRIVFNPREYQARYERTIPAAAVAIQSVTLKRA
jgi:hypothetical protein